MVDRSKAAVLFDLGNTLVRYWERHEFPVQRIRTRFVSPDITIAPARPSGPQGPGTWIIGSG